MNIKNVLNDLIEALEANKVFHTPIARRRLNGWDEYQSDAIERTNLAINSAKELLKFLDLK